MERRSSPEAGRLPYLGLHPQQLTNQPCTANAALEKVRKSIVDHHGCQVAWVIEARDLPLRQVVRRSTVAHEKLELAEAGRLLYDFFWGDFADWYIEVTAKNRKIPINFYKTIVTSAV